MWTPRCNWVGAILVWEETDTCNSQVGCHGVCVYDFFFLILSACFVKNIYLFLFCIVLQLLLIVQSPPPSTPRTRGLILSSSCISVCVHRLSESTQTHLITDKAGGHIPDSKLVKITSTPLQSEATCINLNVTVV